MRVGGGVEVEGVKIESQTAKSKSHDFLPTLKNRPSDRVFLLLNQSGYLMGKTLIGEDVERGKN